MRYFFSWLTICVYSFLILIFSVIPVEPPQPLMFPFSDKIVHALLYGFLSFIAINTFYIKGKRYPKFYSFSYSFCLGLSIEILQLFLPYRSFDVNDIFFNFLGSISGCLIRLV